MTSTAVRGQGGRPAGTHRGLGVIALMSINVAAIVSARNLPMMAVYGWSMLALFAIAIVGFLIPIALVASELGTAWPEEGGVYAWVREASGSLLLAFIVPAHELSLVYALVFAEFIRLRLTQPERNRPYRVPGGTAEMRMVGGVGILASLASLGLGFIPPDQLKTGSATTYVVLLAAATVVLCRPPFAWSAWAHRRARVRPSR